MWQISQGSLKDISYFFSLRPQVIEDKMEHFKKFFSGEQVRTARFGRCSGGMVICI